MVRHSRNATLVYDNQELDRINLDYLNWDAPRKRPCRICEPKDRMDITGSYASTLRHYEQVLGASLTGKKQSVRLFVLFQDPRKLEKGFVACPPQRFPATESNEHRYFCLTKVAWDALGLGLEKRVEEKNPCWPAENTAHHFLARYFNIGHGGRSWSYDGFIAYFLFLFRPVAAYITNLAKCHMGEDFQTEEVYNACVGKHLREELLAFRPNLILSFTGMVREWEGLHTRCGLAQEEVVRIGRCSVLYANHPAAHRSFENKVDRFEESVRDSVGHLEALGYDVDGLLSSWKRHAREVRRRFV